MPCIRIKHKNHSRRHHFHPPNLSHNNGRSNRPRDLLQSAKIDQRMHRRTKQQAVSLGVNNTPDLHHPSLSPSPADSGNSSRSDFPATMIRFPTFQETSTCQPRATAQDSLRAILSKFPQQQSQSQQELKGSSSRDSSPASSTTTSASSSARSSTSSAAGSPRDSQVKRFS